MNYNEVAKIEKAIKDKYGKQAIQNPKSNWDEHKEQKYLNDLKRFYSKNRKKSKESQEAEGFEIVDKKLSKRTERTCPVCSAFSMKIQDDLYMNKFDCCYRCYIEYVEDREERWKMGWRPNK